MSGGLGQARHLASLLYSSRLGHREERCRARWGRVDVPKSSFSSWMGESWELGSDT